LGEEAPLRKLSGAFSRLHTFCPESPQKRGIQYSKVGPNQHHPHLQPLVFLVGEPLKNRNFREKNVRIPFFSPSPYTHFFVTLPLEAKNGVNN
jgi:hypothetical protein